MAEIRTILFPTDFSEHSNKAFPHAAALAQAFGARIVMLHVAELEESDPANPEHSFPALDAYQGEVERVTVRGHAPYKDILDVTRERGCDMVVMATHGRSELSQFFMGRSVAEDVSSFSEVPVFIVPVRDGAVGNVGQYREILAAGGTRAHAEAFAQKFGANVREAGGDDADDIVRLAKEGGVDLIVISSRGRAELREEVTGNIADRVIQQAPCPVLTVRG